MVVFNFFPVQKLILVIFEIAKNGIWSNNVFVKLIYLISRVFFVWTFLNFLARCEIVTKKPNDYITCIADSRDMPELAREPEGVDGGRFILLDISYLLNN